MSTVIETGSHRSRLIALTVLTLVAWLTLVAIVTALEPDPLVHRLAFFVVFAMALAGTCSLATYVLSFRLFASKRYRGNVSRALASGVATSLVLTLAAVLQLARALSVVNVALLIGLFLVLQVVVLLHR